MKRANGSGSIIKLKGNRRKKYACRLTIMDEYGEVKERPYVGYAKTYAEACAILEKYTKNPLLANKTTFGEFSKKWFDRKYINNDELTEGTIKTNITIFKYLQPLNNIELIDLKLVVLQNFIDTIETPHNSMAIKVKNMLSRILEDAEKYELIDKNYAKFLDTKSRKPKEVNIFSADDIKTMWNNLDKIDNIKYVLILIYTGMRIGELLSCKLEYIHNDHIRHGSKTEDGKDRIIPIPLRIKPIINKLMKHNHEYLVEDDNHRPMTTDHFRNSVYNKSLKACNLPLLTPHKCRHTYATMVNELVENKDYVRRVVGHKNFSTTSEVYIHPDQQKLINSVLNL